MLFLPFHGMAEMFRQEKGTMATENRGENCEKLSLYNE